MSRTHNDVAHNWANQTGRCQRGFNMFYEGATIYSYGHHFPIARMVPREETADHVGPCVLFTSKSYSTSTAKHKSFTRRAIHARTFVVPNIKPISKAGDHADNHAAFVLRASEAATKAKRARTYTDAYLREASQAVRDANDYSEWFGLGLPEVTLESLGADVAALVARAEATLAAETAARAKRERAATIANRDRLRDWLAGESVQPPHTRVPMCRVKGDEVETTWGARVPLSDALEAWKLMKYARDAGPSCSLPAALSLGNFQVESITPTGMRVGCHFIPFRFARIAACAAGVL